MQIRKRGVIVSVLILGIIVLAIVVLVPAEERVAWIGGTAAEAEFVVTDEDKGQPIPGATILMTNAEKDLGDFTLITDQTGRVKKFFKNCTCTGQSGRFIDTFYARVPFRRCEVRAVGYQPFVDDGWFRSRNVSPEKRGPRFAEVTVDIKLKSLVGK